MNKTTKNIADMEAQRRELDRQIKAAKRAEKRATEAALLSARERLGVELSMSVGADTLEVVGRLDRALKTGQIQEYLRERIADGSPDTRTPEGGEQHADD